MTKSKNMQSSHATGRGNRFWRAGVAFVAMTAATDVSIVGARAQSGDKPNIVVIMTDDVAPYDISAYHRGLGAVNTKNIDRLATEGVMVSDYYAQPSCTAGRAAFITGQYPIRTGLTTVGQPGSPVGLQKEDPTLAELLKAKGYATAQFGKSHLGDRNEYLPTVHGFDEFYGFLYHLNMMEMPEQPEFPQSPDFIGRPRNVIHALASDKDDATVDKRFGKIGRQTIKDDGPLGAERQKTFDDIVTSKSIEWMKAQAGQKKPFLLWYNPSRMHQEIHVSKDWEGKSGHSRYADGLLHLDSMVGQVLDQIDSLGIRDNTIVLFTSDNGVNLAHWPSAGSAAFRGEKGTTWDGGFRVPMLVRWPGKFPAGKWTGELMTAEDWVPTLMAACGEPNVKDDLLKGKSVGGETYKVHLDGYNQMDMLAGKGPSNRREFFFYGETSLNAARVDQWKVHVAVKNEWLKAAEKTNLVIDIKLDPFERTPEAPGHFAWMKEKSWIAPKLAPFVLGHMKSLQEFPPRQKSSGVGADQMSNFAGPSE